MDGINKRIAVFVEGQTEQIFVRECLLKYYEYDAMQVGIICFRLLSHEMQPVSYNYGDEHSQNLYMIIDSGNDNNVLGAIRRRYEGLRDKYDSIIGLRDKSLCYHGDAGLCRRDIESCEITYCSRSR